MKFQKLNDKSPDLDGLPRAQNMNERDLHHVESLGVISIPGERENPKSLHKEATCKLTVSK